ncbi:MAG: diaminobutyrate--2-oxoglutarate transaminase [Caldilineaceae bacterium]
MTSAMDTFERLESNIRSYCRAFPTIFTRARNATLEDAAGKSYIDFFAGASTLNYGHNNPHFKTALIDYINADGITHGLDMATSAKQRFLETFAHTILQPRNLQYKVQFTGPTGTNAVEAALKLARKVTGRHTIVAFTNGFHGMSLGSVAATGNRHYRQAAGVPLTNVVFMPYDNYFGPEVDTLCYLEKMVTDPGSGLDQPAAIIVETIQGEGGINVARLEWLQRLAALCQRYAILLIVDDIQMGCGRTGAFFSFEAAGITPDLITLSKSLSGYGLPMSVLLIRPEWDQWQPGEHTGTFRGNNLAFVTGAAALDYYWQDEQFAQAIQRKGSHLRTRLEQMIEQHANLPLTVRGRGMIQAIDCQTGVLAQAVCRAAFTQGLVIETSGAHDQVVKCIPPLTIPDEDLDAGLDILCKSLQKCAGSANNRV